MDNTLWWCTLCKKELPKECFSLKKNSKNIFSVNCDNCRNSPMRLWDIKNKEKRTLITKRYVESGKPRIARLKKRYGISKEDYESMLEKQSRSCAICFSEVPLGRYSFFAVDHDHVTRKIRGLLCTNCNRGLGFFKDNIELLRKALNYLKKS